MPRIDIAAIAPVQTRLHEDGELVAELFRDEAAFEEEPSLFVVDLSDDPHGHRRIYFREQCIETPRWTLDPRPVR